MLHEGYLSKLSVPSWEILVGSNNEQIMYDDDRLILNCVLFVMMTFNSTYVMKKRVELCVHVSFSSTL
jgi:hypothetical protein